jgi:hypothetical protein
VRRGLPVGAAQHILDSGRLTAAEWWCCPAGPSPTAARPAS